MLAFINKSRMKFLEKSRVHGGCMHNAYVGSTCNVRMGGACAMRAWGCTHNVHVEGACTMHAWGCTHNVHMGGAHARCGGGICDNF